MAGRLLLLGGSHFYRPLIRIAQALGLEVILVDKNPDTVGRQDADLFEAVDIIDEQGVLEVAKRFAVDAILAANDWGIATASVVAQKLSLRGVHPDVVQRCVNKRLMRERWAEKGCANPRFAVTTNLPQARKAAQQIGYPVMLKASDNRGASRGVMRIGSPDELEKHYEYCKGFSYDETVLVEQCLVGSEHSVEAISIDGEVHILAMCDKIKTPYPYRVDKALLYPTALTKEQREQAFATVREAVMALGIEEGPSHTELAFTKEGPRLFECACRGGGGRIFPDIVRITSGVDYAKATIQQLLGEPIKIEPRDAMACALGFIIPEPGVIASIDGVKQVQNWEWVYACESFRKVGEEVVKVKSGGDRAGYYIITAPERAELERRYQQIEKQTLIDTSRR